MIIIIPSYNPDEHLRNVIDEIHEKTEYRIIAVNDGSKEECIPYFDHLSKQDVLLNHEVNKGKGAAMKTALSYLMQNMHDEDAVIFVDSDGQHKISDVKRVIACFYENPDAIVLGSREFKGEIPWKSSFGNGVTRIFFQLLTGVRLKDTQTGLRAFSTKYIPQLLQIWGERYEYEMNALVFLAKKRVQIKEIMIETVYENAKNETTHFRPIWDSVRIYAVLLKYIMSSSFCAVFDYGIFFALSFFLADPTNGFGVVLCNALARVITAILNYFINRSFVFHSTEAKWKSALKYAALAMFILLFNSGLLFVMSQYLHMPLVWAKLITETLAFCISFMVQQRVIF